MTRQVSASLTRRTLAVMALGVVLMLVVIVATLGASATGRIATAQAELIAELAPAFPPQTCLNAPGGWHLKVHDYAEAWAYDGRTLVGDNPAAPPLTEGVKAGLSTGRRTAVEMGLLQLGGGTFAARVSPEGPCGVIGVVWRPPDRRARWFLVALLIAVAAAGAAGFGFAWVVKPLLARLARVAQLAGRVGTSLQGEPADGVDDEVTQIEQALRKADAELAADRRALHDKTEALERFLLELGHDLKTPLASLALSVEELVTSPNAEAGRSAIAELLYVEQLVENLRLEARLRQGGLQVTSARFDAREVVDRTVAGLMPLARRAGVSLEAGTPEDPVWLEADRALVERAVTNLAHNALSHGAHNVGVTLQAIGAGFVLTISDDGPGLRSGQSARRGEGLGMKIAARSLELTGLSLTYGPGPDGVGTSATVCPAKSRTSDPGGGTLLGSSDGLTS